MARTLPLSEAKARLSELVTEIGISPVKPAEFVIFRIQQKTREPQLV